MTASTLRAAAPMIAVFCLMGMLSLFLRASLGVIAPDMSRELGLTPAELSIVTGSMFVVVAAMQIPTGILLDRFGGRRTMPVALVFTVAGLAWFSVAETGTGLAWARALMGLGTAGCFMGAFFVIARWVPSDRFASYTGFINGMGILGLFLAATPLAATVGLFGWRDTFAGLAVVTVAIAAFGWLAIRDRPPGQPAPRTPPESLGGIVQGVAVVLRTPGVVRLFLTGVPMSSGSVILSLWGGPYLHDVHGLGDIARGNVLLALAGTTACAHFTYGQIDRFVPSRRALMLGAMAAVTVILAVLAALPNPSLVTVTVLFALLGAASGFPPIVHTQARALVPDHLIGRGLTTVNMGIMTAIALLQFASGLLIDAFPRTPEGLSSSEAYRAFFGLYAVVVVIAMVIARRVPETKGRVVG